VDPPTPVPIPVDPPVPTPIPTPGPTPNPIPNYNFSTLSWGWTGAPEGWSVKGYTCTLPVVGSTDLQVNLYVKKSEATPDLETDVYDSPGGTVDATTSDWQNNVQSLSWRMQRNNTFRTDVGSSDDAVGHNALLLDSPLFNSSPLDIDPGYLKGCH
jgi:hypothetical protein